MKRKTLQQTPQKYKRSLDTIMKNYMQKLKKKLHEKNQKSGKEKIKDFQTGKERVKSSADDKD